MALVQTNLHFIEESLEIMYAFADLLKSRWLLMLGLTLIYWDEFVSREDLVEHFEKFLVEWQFQVEVDLFMGANKIKIQLFK